MEDSSFIVESIAGIILFAVGLRVLSQASHTAGRPARYLGAHLVFAGVSYALYEIPLVIPVETLYLPFTYAGRLVYGVSIYFLLEFTRSVFRSDEAWGRWLVHALMLSLVVGDAVSTLQGDWEGYQISSPWFWCEWLGYTLAPLWVGVEGLLAYASARKRVRLDLCDRIVANRYLLWGLFGIFQVICSLIIVPMYADFEDNQRFAAGADALLGSFEILAAVMTWFAFSAPSFYRNWILRRAPAADAGKRI